MGNTSAAPQSTPHSIKGGDGSKLTEKPDPVEVMYQQNLFYMTVLNMSWQLAIAVIVPIVAGFKFDEHFNTAPWLAVAGLFVAAATSMLVVWGTVKRASAKADKGARG